MVYAVVRPNSKRKMLKIQYKTVLYSCKYLKCIQNIFVPLEKEMTTRSSVLAWGIPLRGAWQAMVHRVTKSQTFLND